jgi:hypothetical protein
MLLAERTIAMEPSRCAVDRCASFHAADLAPEGVTRWHERIPVDCAGVYAVALAAEIAELVVLPAAPLSHAATRRLLAVRPELTLFGRRPSSRQLARRVAAFWLPDETILYIGKATSLQSRVGGYYRTRLGARRPHAGGWWLKLLEPEALAQLRVHYARVERPELAEDQMMGAFCGRVSRSTRLALPDPEHPFPFANLEWHTRGRKLRKRHGLRGATGPLSAAGLT